MAKKAKKEIKWKRKTESEKDKEYEVWCMKALRPLLLLFTLLGPFLALSSNLVDYTQRNSMANIAVVTSRHQPHRLVAVLTGATDVHGMGYNLATKLVDSGYSIILGGRNKTATQTVVQLLQERVQLLHHQSSTTEQFEQYVESFPLQLHDLSSVHAFTGHIQERTGSTGIHLLADVAGELGGSRGCTATQADQIEYIVQVNAVAHHVLIEGLLKPLRDGASKRHATTATQATTATTAIVPSRIVVVVDNIRAAPTTIPTHLWNDGDQRAPTKCTPKTQYHTAQLLLSMYNAHVHTAIQSNPISRHKIQTFTIDPGRTNTHFSAKGHSKRTTRNFAERLPPVRLVKWLLSFLMPLLPELQRSTEHAALGLYHVATSATLDRRGASSGHLFFQDTLSMFVGCELTGHRKVCGATELKDAIGSVGSVTMGDHASLEQMCLQVFNGLKKIAKGRKGEGKSKKE